MVAKAIEMANRNFQWGKHKRTLENRDPFPVFII
jgi:hypothetical protein